jgi:glutamine phosphoribosylpyrophosphate amidotransferase
MSGDTAEGSDKLHEECGIFGVFCDDPERDAAELVYYGLLSLQHRGQESAGIAAVKDKTIECRKGMGLAVLTDNALVGARDTNGIRPLCLGSLPGGWILASESCAIDAVGGEFVRDVEPGEVIWDARWVRTAWPLSP